MGWPITEKEHLLLGRVIVSCTEVSMSCDRYFHLLFSYEYFMNLFNLIVK